MGGYVYKITNTLNNKSYIGISIYEPTQGRIKDHLSGQGNRLIANAVKKYGKDAFTYEILEANVFDEFLPDLEVAYIANFNTVAPNGYNLDSGGSHAIPSESTRRKMSEAMRRKRKPLSPEHRRKISEAQKGKKRKPPSESTRRKMSEANSGRKHSEEARRKVSRAKISNAHLLVRSYFFSLPLDMPLKEKRQLIFSKFPDVPKPAIYKWVQKSEKNRTDNQRPL